MNLNITLTRAEYKQAVWSDALANAAADILRVSHIPGGIRPHEHILDYTARCMDWLTDSLHRWEVATSELQRHQDNPTEYMNLYLRSVWLKAVMDAESEIPGHEAIPGGRHYHEDIPSYVARIIAVQSEAVSRWHIANEELKAAAITVAEPS